MTQNIYDKEKQHNKSLSTKLDSSNNFFYGREQQWLWRRCESQNERDLKFLSLHWNVATHNMAEDQLLLCWPQFRDKQQRKGITSVCSMQIMKDVQWTRDWSHPVLLYQLWSITSSLNTERFLTSNSSTDGTSLVTDLLSCSFQDLGSNLESSAWTNTSLHHWTIKYLHPHCLELPASLIRSPLEGV